MKKPDSVFLIRVCPVFRLTGCEEKLAQEKRGMFGFHSFSTCPNCKVVADGWQMWGSNGHCQADIPTRERLIHWIKIKAREQWKMKSGGVMGYRFEVGSSITYRAN